LAGTPPPLLAKRGAGEYSVGPLGAELLEAEDRISNRLELFGRRSSVYGIFGYRVEGLGWRAGLSAGEWLRLATRGDLPLVTDVWSPEQLEHDAGTHEPISVDEAIEALMRNERGES
jgi:hypothetical protein